MMQHQDQYLRELRRQGYIIVRSLGKHHLKIYDLNGCLVAVHSGNGGSDRRSLKNLQADIRRHQCSAGEKQGEHVQREPGGDERRPDRPRGDNPRYDRRHGEQEEGDQDQETVDAADSKTVSENMRHVHDDLRIEGKMT